MLGLLCYEGSQLLYGACLYLINIRSESMSGLSQVQQTMAKLSTLLCIVVASTIVCHAEGMRVLIVMYRKV